MVKSANFAVLGKNIAPDLGKKGPATDLAFYDRKDSDVIRTWVHPTGYPEKIQPMIQAVTMSEFVVFCVESLDRFAGEQIIALDMLKKDRGVLLHTFEVDAQRLEGMIKGTVVEKYTRVTKEKIKEAVDAFEPVQCEGPTKIVIDQCFDVKGVGTVILGNVTSGMVKQYDTLKLYPGGMEILVKSIQMHDAPVTESAAPARVGLAVKGVKPEDVGRGDVLCMDADVRTEISLDFVKSPFYKGEPTEGQGCLACVGLQIKAARFSSLSPLVLVFEKELVCEKGQTILVLKPESDTIRIMGSGTIR
ncbi:MAG: elongation factor Tu [Nitrosopumilus sp. B06]|nr:MAG: elongation factor Tu [Nitrosopumilus sp. B06]